MVIILEKINEFIERIRENIPNTIYQKIIHMRDTFLRDYPLFVSFLENEFDESQDDFTPNQYYQFLNVNLREIFPKLTKSCINFHLADIYEELVRLVSQIEKNDLYHLFQEFISFQNILAEENSTNSPFPRSLLETNTIATIFSITLIPEVEQKINPLMENDNLESVLIKFLNEPKIEDKLKKAEQYIEQKVSQPLNIPIIEENVWEDFAHNIQQYYEGMQIYAILFCNIFDLVFFNQRNSKNEFKKKYIKNLYKEILEPEGRKKRQVGLFTYLSKLSDFPLLKQFLKYLFQDVRKLRNEFSHNPNHHDLIFNNNTIQKEILNFMQDATFFQLFPSFLVMFLISQIFESNFES
jgi:hypothetical protein